MACHGTGQSRLLLMVAKRFQVDALVTDARTACVRDQTAQSVLASPSRVAAAPLTAVRYAATGAPLAPFGSSGTPGMNKRPRRSLPPLTTDVRIRNSPCVAGGHMSPELEPAPVIAATEVTLSSCPVPMFKVATSPPTFQPA